MLSASSSTASSSSDCSKAFGLTVLHNKHRDIRRLRKDVGYPSHHGNKMWGSSVLLMDYFSRHPLARGARVLEVGCGWGLVGIFCAKKFHSEVTGLDIDPGVLPFMRHHAAINDVEVDTMRCSYEKASTALLAQFDVVVGGDICFWDQLSNPLFNLARRAHNVGARVVISDPGRPPYTQMAERCCQRLGAALIPWKVRRKPHSCAGYVLDIPGAF